MQQTQLPAVPCILLWVQLPTNLNGGKKSIRKLKGQIITISQTTSFLWPPEDFYAMNNALNNLKGHGLHRLKCSEGLKVPAHC